MKKCRTCKEVKILRHFCFDAHSADGKRGNCKECANASSKSYNDKNKEKIRARFLVESYGITSEQYAEMFKHQRGLCVICLEPSLGQRLAIDHCHKTGRVRGLLCSPCNRGLGNFKDDSERLARASVYISSTQTLNGKS